MVLNKRKKQSDAVALMMVLSLHQSQKLTVQGEQIFTKQSGVSQERCTLMISLYHNDLSDSGDSFNTMR